MQAVTNSLLERKQRPEANRPGVIFTGNLLMIIHYCQDVFEGLAAVAEVVAEYPGFTIVSTRFDPAAIPTTIQTAQPVPGVAITMMLEKRPESPVLGS